MASLRARADHQAAVARRLDELTAELGGGPDPTAGHTRVRPLRVVPSDDVPPTVPLAARPAPTVPTVPTVPRPGRHADRRSTGALVPEAVRGRVALGPSQLAVVAVLVAVGVIATGWWLVRGDPHEVVAPAAPAVAGGSAAPLADLSPVAGSAVPSSASSAAAEVTVDVTGKVRRPGIVVLDVGARVVDAVAAAGGARRGVDLSSLNLARVLVDGEQIVVGAPAPASAPGAVLAPGAAPGAVGAPVNLNTATQAELESLPDVGPVTAQAILAWRDEHGRFTSVDELLEVDGIGDATLAKIAPHATV